MIVLSYKLITVNSWSIQTQCICPGNCIRFALSCMFLCPNISSFWLSIIMIKGNGPKHLVLLYSVILRMNLPVIAAISFVLIRREKQISSSLLLIKSTDKISSFSNKCSQQVWSIYYPAFLKRHSRLTSFWF